MVLKYFKNFFDEIFEASNVMKAKQIYEKFKSQIIITDIQMPKVNGLAISLNADYNTSLNILNAVGTTVKAS